MLPAVHLLTSSFAQALLGLALLYPLTTAHADTPTKARLTTSAGDIVLQLDAEQAPATVANFVQYIQDGHYNGTIFHRVIDGFMIQGGGFDQEFSQKTTRAPIRNEAREAMDRGGPGNTVGTIAMARTADPHSASAQFFINIKDNSFLNPATIPPGDPVPKFEYQGQVARNVPRAQLLSAPQLAGYAVFGRVIAGMDVVNRIKGTRTGSGGPFPSDVPQTPITIIKATLEK